MCREVFENDNSLRYFILFSFRYVGFYVQTDSENVTLIRKKNNAFNTADVRHPLNSAKYITD